MCFHCLWYAYISFKLQVLCQIIFFTLVGKLNQAMNIFFIYNPLKQSYCFSLQYFLYWYSWSEPTYSLSWGNYYGTRMKCLNEKFVTRYLVSENIIKDQYKDRQPLTHPCLPVALQLKVISGTNVICKKWFSKSFFFSF